MKEFPFRFLGSLNDFGARTALMLQWARNRSKTSALGPPALAASGAAALSLVLLLGSPLHAQNSTVTFEIKDHRGNPVEGAVVSLRLDGAEAQPLESSVMDQIEEAFVPSVLAIPVGTPVSFPNHDDVRHHVYSFSEAKEFELPLYEGTPTNPILFDQAGVVVLGCNIHDWMRGYIFVADTPHYALSKEGVASLSGLPPGQYAASVWHSRLRGDQWTQDLSLGSGDSPTLEVELRLKPELKIRRAPKAGKTKYD